MKKLSRAEKIRRHIKANPTQPLKEVAEKFNTTYQIVYMIKRDMEKRNKGIIQSIMNRKPIMAEFTREEDGTITEKVWTPMHVSVSDKPLPVTMHEPAPDPVNHPAHYKTGGIETIDFIEAKGLNYNLGNVVKYITRADHKGDRKQDLEKAAWYLAREIGKVL